MKIKKKFVVENLKTILALIAVVLGVGIFQAFAGVTPGCAAPNCNASGPIDQSVVAESKLGVLTIQGQATASTSAATGFWLMNGRANFGSTTATIPSNLEVGVNGNVGASAYCDQNGGNCTTASTFTSGGIPDGAVMAFNLTSCPSGWSPFTYANGREIIGTGQSSANGATSHTLGQSGGEETHTLAISELPTITSNNRNNTITAASGSNGSVLSGGTHSDSINSYSTSMNTKDTPFGVTGPYVALLYCQKGAGSYGGVLTITSPTNLPNGTHNVSYSYQLTASGGAGSYTWTATYWQGNYGLSLSSAGLISGINYVQGGGDTILYAQVKDAGGTTVSKEFIIYFQ